MPRQHDPHARRHILTVVLEDYCHVGPVSRVVPTDYWHRFESRVERNTQVTLDLLDEYDVKATFFSLGWIADHQPDVIAEVVRRGHEIASKGYFHRSLRQMSQTEFRDDAVRSRDSLERAGGAEVRGYRIAKGWFLESDLWALDVLSRAGFVYDSSIMPLGFQFTRHPYRRFLHRHQGPFSAIWEVPVSSRNIGPISIPFSGGNYVRQFPEGFMKRAAARWDAEVPTPMAFYFHIWELDPDQPRITAASPLQKIRQYRNLHLMDARIRYYLETYPFTSIADYLALAPAEPRARGPVAKPEAGVSAAPATVSSKPRTKPLTPLTVVVPCYNEEATLGYLAKTIETFAQSVANEFELSYVMVDDGSQDGTWDRLQVLFGNDPNCRFVRHEKNRGVAAATLTGIANATTEIVCAIDCDGTYDPQQLRAMVPMMSDKVDLVTASPYHEFGQVLNLPTWRLVLSRSLSVIYRQVLHHKLATYTSCFRVYRKTAIEGIHLKNEGYVGITEILAQLDMKGRHIAECPAVMEVRLLGHSKMKILKTIFGHLKLLGQLIGERWLAPFRFMDSRSKGAV